MGCRDLEPMSKWVKGEGQGCRPCKVTVGIGKYRKTLEAAGQGDLAEVVSSALEDDEDTALKVATAMDEVKAKASPEVKARLESIDCEIQNKEECGACDVPLAPTPAPPA